MNVECLTVTNLVSRAGLATLNEYTGPCRCPSSQGHRCWLGLTSDAIIGCNVSDQLRAGEGDMKR